MFAVFLMDIGAEGEGGELCQFEALQAEGDTDDGDAEEQGGQKQTDRHLKSAENEPDHIGDGVLAKIEANLCPHGP